MKATNTNQVTIEALTKKIIAFRNERDWKQFHNPKDVAMSLVLEAGEVMEHFQWKSSDEIQAYVESHKEDIAEELADTLYWVLLLAHDLDIDIVQASNDKLAKNAQKYPVEKAKGKHTKYDQL